MTQPDRSPDNKLRQEIADEHFADALLRELHSAGDTEADARRIDRLLELLDEKPDRHVEQPERTRQSRASSSWGMDRPNPWIRLALAASLLTGLWLGFAQLFTPGSAHAAVVRSLNAVPPLRAYRVQMLQQFPLWGERKRTFQLYLNDQDQFVAHAAAWNRWGELWIGGNPQECWIVPPLGPAFVGGEEVISHWLVNKDIPSPYLHVSTILERMSRVYELEMLPDEEIADQSNSLVKTWCKHVRGTLSTDSTLTSERRNGSATRNTKSRLPASIELWADRNSGVAVKLILTWDYSPPQQGSKQWTIELYDAPELLPNWFHMESHIDHNRAVIQVTKPSDLNGIDEAATN